MEQIAVVKNLLSNGMAQVSVERGTAWGAEPIELSAQLQKTHIFTHIRWDMTGYVFRCARMDGRFVWADDAMRRREYALPTAFRKFLEEEGKSLV